MVGVGGAYRLPAKLPATGPPPCVHVAPAIGDVALASTAALGTVGFVMLAGIACSDGCSNSERDSADKYILLGLATTALFVTSGVYGAHMSQRCASLPRYSSDAEEELATREERRASYVACTKRRHDVFNRARATNDPSERLEILGYLPECGPPPPAPPPAAGSAATGWSVPAVQPSAPPVDAGVTVEAVDAAP